MGAKLYAIYAGVGGFTGVVKGSNRARELTQGVAGAKQCACDTREQAERFINYFHIRRAGVRGWDLEDIEAAAAELIEVSTRGSCRGAVSYTHLTLPTTPYV